MNTKDKELKIIEITKYNETIKDNTKKAVRSALCASLCASASVLMFYKAIGLDYSLGDFYLVSSIISEFASGINIKACVDILRENTILKEKIEDINLEIFEQGKGIRK